MAVLDMTSGQIHQLGDTQVSEIQLDQDLVSPYAVGFDYNPYYKYVSWQGILRRDVYQVEIATGNKKLIKKDLHGYADISPNGKYVYWYSLSDTTWFVYDNESSRTTRINIDQTFANERNDVPTYPWAYGAVGWTEGDEALLLYDRFDIWRYDAESGTTARITQGRESRTSYRYIDLDYENEAISPDKMLLSTFNEISKDEGFVQMKKLKAVKTLLSGPFDYSNPVKAYDSDNLIYTKQSHLVFPDLLASDLSFKQSTRLSDANAEISNYLWGTVEMHQWISLDGIELEGLLYKPEGFDATKKYPMITYFYERNSDNLHRHWGAVPIRSIVNPAFYASRGYLVFIPDIVYTTGYPGKSCYNAVVPGVQSLIEEGYVDSDNIGVQGHSWGGYQVAYLVTQTDIFKAAEAGAVVSNMISAYGGIRWWTGLSRMFQYERTQSRIGATLWEKPDLYIENSPIFMVDKINTPLLLMHNDQDGHVPWYQGIEFFVALRRLNKPAWMLNYNGEPHWPTKYENIRDFNIRMQQFFDHFLMDAPLPRWMSEDGIPAIEKGINNGLELINEE
jgi:dipeptidyl aminopeptidase/acylaminoacyl peptidase